MDRDLVVVDVETTGQNPLVHDLLALALVPVTGEAAPLELYVRSGKELAWTECGQKNFQNFAEEWHTNAVSPQEAMDKVEGYIAKNIGSAKVTLVGHNVGFDVLFLRKLAMQAGRSYDSLFGHRTIDTHTLLYLGSLQNRWPSTARASEGAFESLGVTVPAGKRHTALGDAIATKSLFLRLVDRLSSESDMHVAEHRVAR